MSAERTSVQGPRLRPLFERAGARWLELPVLHPADPFLETAGEDIRRKMFVTEGRSGERLALRPDFTIPVSLEHLSRGAAAGRYAYEGVVFRRHDSGAPERLETGFEDIGGTDEAVADAQMLALAVESVAALTSGTPRVRLGDIGLFAALLKALGLPGRWRRRLRRSFGAPAALAANLERLSPPRSGVSDRLDATILAAADGPAGALAALLTERAAAQGLPPGLGRSPAEIAERFLDARALPDAALAARAVQVLRRFLDLSAGVEPRRRMSASATPSTSSPPGQPRSPGSALPRRSASRPASAARSITIRAWSLRSWPVLPKRRSAAAAAMTG
jgi:ATP phosphoribosyltransferase regulatory subunit